MRRTFSRWLQSVFLLLLVLGNATSGFAADVGLDDFLPVEKAFTLDFRKGVADSVNVTFTPAPSYYLYRERLGFAIIDPALQPVRTLPLSPKLPPGERKQDPNFGEVEVYHTAFEVSVPLRDAPAVPSKSASTSEVAVPATVLLRIGYQGCSEKGLCYPPVERLFRVEQSAAAGVIDRQMRIVEVAAADAPAEASRSAPAVPAAVTVPPPAAGDLDSENAAIAKVLGSGNAGLVIAAFFGFGLLLSLTPCVFPMIPILSGMIVGDGMNVTRRRSFLLSVAYVLGMALTYAAAGVAAGLSGALLSNALQSPWVLGTFAGVFVILALSMFGVFELQLPGTLQTRLTGTSNRLPGGRALGVFLMGALSALIVGPCVAAPLAGALLYIGQTRNVVLGGLALFSMAIGMGVPLLLIGASAGALLPKAGVWMISVKRVFGMLLLAVALWLVSPVISTSVLMLGAAALLIVSAMMLRALDRLAPDAAPLIRIGKGAGIMLLLAGAALMIGLLSGGRDLLQPLAHLGNTGASMAPAPIRFTRIASSAALDAQLRQSDHRTVMLDFYADWCVSCKEMEKLTFTDPAVAARLGNMLLLQADVTANNEDDKMLLKRFGLFGPPGILFFDSEHNELQAARVIGYQNPEKFHASLAHVPR